MSELEGLQNSIRRPKATTSRNYNQALRIIGKCPDDVIKERTEGKYAYRVSPSFVAHVTYENGAAADVSVAIALRLGKQGFGREKWGQKLFLIADDNLREPIVEITEEPSFSFEMPQSGTDISDEEIDLVLNKIEAAIDDIVSDRQRAAQRAAANRRETTKKTLRTVGVALALFGAAAGSYFGGSMVINNHNAQREASERAFWDQIARHDGKGYVLQAELIRPGDAGPAATDRLALSELNETPEFQDLLDSTRKLKITADETKKIAEAPLGKGVRVASNAPDGHVTVTVLDDGSVWLSALPSDGNPVYDVIIQSGQLPKQ